MVSLKFQTAKINQGNIALKRVVESIANGDSHVPFRDSKLTMLLQVKLQSSCGAIYDSPFLFFSFFPQQCCVYFVYRIHLRMISQKF